MSVFNEREKRTLLEALCLHALHDDKSLDWEDHRRTKLDKISASKAPLSVLEWNTLFLKVHALLAEESTE